MAHGRPYGAHGPARSRIARVRRGQLLWADRFSRISIDVLTFPRTPIALPALAFRGQPSERLARTTSSRARVADLLIAPTAAANGLPLYTRSPSDFVGLDELAGCSDQMPERETRSLIPSHTSETTCMALRTRPAPRAEWLASISIVGVMFMACCVAMHAQAPSSPPPTSAPTAAPQRSDAVAGVLSDEDVKKQITGKDASGEFIQIDDMRFRINQFYAWGFEGNRWPNGVFAYDFAPDVRADAVKVARFKAACEKLTAGSAIGCFDRALSNPVGKQHYVLVHNDPGNYSYVGLQGGMQTLGLYNWDYEFIIAHEIKHALGWHHEHQRPDRDQYIKINLANVEPGKESNFMIMAGATTRHPYDFESVMHYSPTAFSKNTLKTIEALPQYAAQEAQMGQRTHFSAIDLAEIKAIYGLQGTAYCGSIPEPRNPPTRCFFACHRAADPRYGRWFMCGSCAGAEICP